MGVLKKFGYDQFMGLIPGVWHRWSVASAYVLWCGVSDLFKDLCSTMWVSKHVRSLTCGRVYISWYKASCLFADILLGYEISSLIWAVRPNLRGPCLIWVCSLVDEVSQLVVVCISGFGCSGLFSVYISGCEVVYHRMGVSDVCMYLSRVCSLIWLCLYVLGYKGPYLFASICPRLCELFVGWVSQDVRSLILLSVCPEDDIPNLFWVHVPGCKVSDLIVCLIPMV